jgi:hypothetical protein
MDGARRGAWTRLSHGEVDTRPSAGRRTSSIRRRIRMPTRSRSPESARIFMMGGRKPGRRAPLGRDSIADRALGRSCGPAYLPNLRSRRRGLATKHGCESGVWTGTTPNRLKRGAPGEIGRLATARPLSLSRRSTPAGVKSRWTSPNPPGRRASRPGARRPWFQEPARPPGVIERPGSSPPRAIRRPSSRSAAETPRRMRQAHRQAG